MWIVLLFAEVESRTQGLRPRPRTQKKNSRLRPRTAFPITDPLEAQDRNARGQGQECSRPRTKDTVANVLKKKAFKKVFQAISNL